MKAKSKTANSWIAKALGIALLFSQYSVSDAVAATPVITVPPVNQTVQIGSDAIFAVQATSGTFLSYQWYFQTNAIPGATNDIYTCTNAQLADAGTYYAAVSNADGTVNSGDADLTVVTHPVISINSTSSAKTPVAGAGSLTWSHTIKSGNNRALFVGISLEDGNISTSVTYGGTAMTLVGRRTGNHTAEIWQLIAPAMGTADIVATFLQPKQVVGGASAFNNVNQTTPTGTFAGAGGTSTAPAVTLASAAGELVFDTLYANDDPTVMVGADQIPQWSLGTGSGTSTAHGAGSTKIGAPSVTMSWNLSNSFEWEIGAVSIKPAPIPLINVAPNAGLVTTEAGGVASFFVSLYTAPTADVVIPITSSNPSEGTISAANLTFTPVNWSTPQQVTVTGVDDALADGFQPFSIVLAPATSSDANFDALDAADVQVASRDDDIKYGLITVNTTSDGSDGDTSSLAALAANPGADSSISLREAILAANKTENGEGGADRIHFSIGGTGVHAIVPASALPVITNAVVIDGTTQPGASANTLTIGDNAVPLIELSGASAGSANGLALGAGSDGSTIRGLVINRFSLSGIQLDSTGNLIVGNFIGTDASGTSDLGNSTDGVTVSAINNIIGTSAVADRNLIAGNDDEPIDVDPGVTGSVIQGNYLGVNASGTAAIPNGTAGTAASGFLLIEGNDSIVGGSNPGEGNLVSGSTHAGIFIASTGNTVQGNLIGTDATGTLALANQGPGVRIGHISGVQRGGTNLIGGTTAGARNIIAFNTRAGISLDTDAGNGNALLGNSLHSNSRLGIDLGANGVTGNDSGDADTGPNNSQNFAVLGAAYARGSQVTIMGTLNSTANGFFRVEFFAGPVADTSGYGEGARYLGFANVTTDSSGNATLETTLTAAVAVGEFVSATVTQSDTTFMTFSDTSEFANSIAAAPSADVVTTLSGPTSVAAFTNVTYTVTLSNRGPATASSVVASATLDSRFVFNSASAGGTYLGGVVTWPPLANLAGSAATDYTVTVTSPSKGLLTNTVSSTSATWDPNPSDNDGSAATARVITAVTSLKPDKTSSGASVATLNWSHTVSPGSARILIVGVSIDVTNATVIAARFAGFLPLTPIGQTNGSNTKVAMYYLLNPPVGTFPITINLDTFAGIVGGAASFSGVDQASPIVAFAGNVGTGAGSTASVTVESSLGGFVIDTVAPKSPTRAVEAGPEQVVAWNRSSENYSGAGSTMAGDASVSPSWTINRNEPWAMAAVALKPALILADVAVTVSGPPAVMATSNLTYSITVTNRGLDAATDVLVSDVLPAGATFVSASGGGTESAGVVTWPTLSNFAHRATTNYTVTITAPATGPLTNRVYSTAPTADPDPSNNNGTGSGNQVVTTVATRADVAATVTGPTSVLAAADFSYTVTLTNAGPSPASNVVVSDTLPPGTTFVSATDGGTHDAGVVTWSLASLGSGATATFTATVTPPPAGSLTNTVASTSATADPDLSNNNGSASAAQVFTTVTPVADIATTVTGPASVTTNAAFNYTVAVANLGPSDASSVSVSDTLPTGVVFVSASSGGTHSAGVVTWSLASLDGGVLTNFTVTVIAPGIGGLTNVVTSSSVTGDPDVSNNDGSAVAAKVVTGVYPFLWLTGQLLPSGGFQVEFHTYPDTIYSIEASPNLVDWVTLITTNSGAGHVIFIDQGVASYPQRFYRSSQ